MVLCSSMRSIFICDKPATSRMVCRTSFIDVSRPLPKLYIWPGFPRFAMNSKAAATSRTSIKSRVASNGPTRIARGEHSGDDAGHLSSKLAANVQFLLTGTN